MFWVARSARRFEILPMTFWTIWTGRFCPWSAFPCLRSSTDSPRSLNNKQRCFLPCSSSSLNVSSSWGTSSGMTFIAMRMKWGSFLAFGSVVAGQYFQGAVLIILVDDEPGGWSQTPPKLAGYCPCAVFERLAWLGGEVAQGRVELFFGEERHCDGCEEWNVYWTIGVESVTSAGYLCPM